MAEDTECAVCFEEFDTPKLLPCTHTFCLKCLEKLERHKRITCPTCNKRHKVPDRGALAFMENPHAVALVAAKKELREMKALKEQMESMQLQDSPAAINGPSATSGQGTVDGAAAASPADGVTAGAAAFPADGATSGAAGDASTVTFGKQKLALMQCEYNQKSCNYCKKYMPVSQLKKCNQCHVAKYCSRPCQVSDWKEKHKRHCKEMLRLKEAIAAGGSAVASSAPSGILNGIPIQLEKGPKYYRACVDGNKLIVVGGAIGVVGGGPEDVHTVVVYDTKTGEKIASHLESSWEQEVVAMCVAKNKRRESLLVVSIDAPSGWRLELWSADFRRPQILDAPYHLPGPAGPLCFTDGMLLVVNMAKSCIEEYTVGASRIKRVGVKFSIPKPKVKICTMIVYNNLEYNEKRIVLGYQERSGEVKYLSCYLLTGRQLWVETQQVQENGYNLRTSICSDNSNDGGIYIARSCKNVVTLMRDDVDNVEVAHTPGAVQCMAWCNTTNHLWVVHCNKDATRMLASRHDVLARARETPGERLQPELYHW